MDLSFDLSTLFEKTKGTVKKGTYAVVFDNDSQSYFTILNVEM